MAYPAGMERQIDIHEADGHLTDLLRDIAAGESVTLTEDGRPVARVVPVGSGPNPKRAAELAAYLATLPIQVVDWKREDLYD